MFVCSMRPSRKWALAAVLAVGIVLLAAVLWGNRAEDTRVVSGRPVSVTVENNAQRVAFLEGFGWTVSEEACEIVDVAIPTEFNEVYETYNAIQKQQGFDLSQYRGRQVRRYTYTVTNYPDHPDYVRANLLVYNNQVIGGDICSLELDGFMHGFRAES